MVGFVSFLIVFSLLVLAHELGHFVTAKLRGVRVQEFGFGYPPRLLRLGTWRDTVFTLNALPFGGFVRMAETDPSAAGALANKPPLTRFLVYVGGPLMNVILAAVLFSVVYMLGAPVPEEGPGAGIYYVAERSPAQAAGLQPGDTILEINGETVRDVEHAVEIISAHAGVPLELVVRRAGRVLPPVEVTPRVDPPPNEGALGVALDLPLVWKTYPPWQAIPMGTSATLGALRSFLLWVLAAVRGETALQVTGVVGIYSITREVAKTGAVRLMELTAGLSLSLAIVQMLPLPALDGGHVVFVVLEWLRGGRRIPPEKEGMVHAVGMALLLMLMVVISVVDYMRYFG